VGRKGRLVPKNAHLTRDLALSQSLPWGLVKSLGRKVAYAETGQAGIAEIAPSWSLVPIGSDAAE